MRNYMEFIVTKKYKLIVEEKDVTRTLNVINSHHRFVPDMKVGNCGWADDDKKWFIHFATTKAKWRIIREELKVQRVFETRDIPKQTNGVIYSTD